MVIKDFTDSSNPKSINGPAPYIDRFFASVIDFMILTPLISLFTGGILNDIRWSMFNKSADIAGLIFQYLFLAFALFLLYEVLFIYFHGATPGHRFLYMKVVTQNGRHPTLMSVLFRTVFKFQAILLGCIPFVEVILRPDRTLFYERVSQTKLITLRESKYDEVHPDFKKIVLRWTHTLVILFFMTVGMVFYKTVTTAETKLAALNSKSKCTESLEQHLRNYLSRHKESENLNCARELVEKAFENPKTNLSFNYLARYIVTESDDLKNGYREKYCAENKTKPICAKEESQNYVFAKLGDDDVLNLLVIMNEALDKNEHAQVFRILDMLYSHLDWNKNLELYYMTSYMFLNEGDGRSPASEKRSSSNWREQKARFLQRMRVTP